MNLNNIYPYLMPGMIDPTWESIVVHIGHNVYATLFEDDETPNGIVHRTVSPDAIAKSDMSAQQLHQYAIDNLIAFARSGELPMQMLGEPGANVNFLLFSGHPRASACLRLPDLYGLACEYLKTNDICACVPQRESLVLMPARDAEYRTSIVNRLREIEADAERPISFDLFDLRADGITAHDGLTV